MPDSADLILLIGQLFAAVLIGSAILGWLGELRRVGSATSAREIHRRHTERVFRPAQVEQEDRIRQAYFAKERKAREIRRRRQGHTHRPRPRPKARAARSTAGGGPRTGSPPPPAAPPPAAAQHRATLGLTGPVSASALRAAYLRQIAAYHPDRVATLGVKLRLLAEEETKRINVAYAYLRKHDGL